MHPDQLADFERRLRKQRTVLSGDLAALSAELNQRKDCATTDQIDLASLQESMRRASALRDRKQALLNDVEAALARIASGRYGISEKTGEAIPVERLHAVPWAHD